jgi:hypothetical protein
MGYHGAWNSTDQIPERAISSGLIDRFGTIDPSDGGHTYRYSGTVDWQHGSEGGDASTRVTAYGIGYDLDLFSNFTYDLNDPIHGDQIEQADRRFIAGGKVSHRRVTRWAHDAEHGGCPTAQRRHHQRGPVSHSSPSAPGDALAGGSAREHRRRVRAE